MEKVKIHLFKTFFVRGERIYKQLKIKIKLGLACVSVHCWLKKIYFAVLTCSVIGGLEPDPNPGSSGI